MNLRAYVEIELTKNEVSYRAYLPIGTPWKDAHAALLEMADGVLSYQQQLEKQAEEQKKEEDKSAANSDGESLADIKSDELEN